MQKNKLVVMTESGGEREVKGGGDAGCNCVTESPNPKRRMGTRIEHLFRLRPLTCRLATSFINGLRSLRPIKRPYLEPKPQAIDG